MTRIFISYRRDDSEVIAGRIYDRLIEKSAFGRENVFKDVDAIPFGVDFREFIDSSVGVHDAILVIIGPKWLDITDEHGRRLDNPKDFVRIEVETALARGNLVVPLLVNNARMPEENELPDSLKKLAYRNAARVRNDPDFHNDMDRLITDLKRSFKTPNRAHPQELTTARRINRGTWIGLGALLVVALVVIGLVAGGVGPFGDDDTSTPTPDLTQTQAAIAAAATLTPTPTEEPTLTPTPTEEPTLTPTLTEEPTLTPTPTEEPALTPIPSECEGFLTPRLTEGEQGCVSDIVPNALRPEPESAIEEGIIPPGGDFFVLEGPRCTQGTETVWWRVDYLGLEGWTAEGSGSTYWLAPSPCPAAEPIAAGTRNRTWTPYSSNATILNGNEDIDIPIVYVPAGCFMMGSEEANGDETPVHEVCLSAFWLGQTEVTNAQYRVCVEQGACDLPTNSLYYSDPTYDDHPVVYVTWHNARQYALWAGGLLPTEAQWEYAARGPEDWVYPWGNAFNGTRLNYCDTNCASYDRDLNVNDGYKDTAPVGSYPEGVSWVGALDMSGNVWEWIADSYDQYFYSTSAASQTDPTGPELGAGRVIRGGSWSSIDYRVRASFRSWDGTTVSQPYYGFRVAFSGE